MVDLAPLRERLAGLAGTRVSGLRLNDGVVSLVLDVTGLTGDARTELAGAIHSLLTALPDISDVRIVQTSEKLSRRIIAIASGKGGVGKSTVTANLAVALKRLGRRVGVIDADIYGPSQPRLLATEGQRPKAEGQKLIPVMSPFGFAMLSMGHLAKSGQAIAWRGPMAGNALGQLMDADRGDTELLLIDLPPGTGDIHLSLIQKQKPAGAVIVSTPQDLSLIDATRAIDLFDKAGVPIIGLIENMAGYACPHCGGVSDPFGRGGVQAHAEHMGHAFLGAIPLTLALRSESDAGRPPAATNSETGAPFHALGARIIAWLDQPPG